MKNEPVLILQPGDVAVYFWPDDPAGGPSLCLGDPSFGWFLWEFYRGESSTVESLLAGIEGTKPFAAFNRLPDSELQRLIDLGKSLYKLTR